MGQKSSRRYPEELKQRAVQMVVDLRGESVSEWEAMGRVADLLGIGTLRRCVSGFARPRSTRVRGRGRPVRNRRFCASCVRENAELKRAIVILGGLDCLVA